MLAGRGAAAHLPGARTARPTLRRVLPRIALEHVDDVGEDDQADDGEKHQDEDIEHGSARRGAGTLGRAAASLAGPRGSAASPPAPGSLCSGGRRKMKGSARASSGGPRSAQRRQRGSREAAAACRGVPLPARLLLGLWGSVWGQPPAVCSQERALPTGREARTSLGHRKAPSVGQDRSELPRFRLRSILHLPCHAGCFGRFEITPF